MREKRIVRIRRPTELCGGLLAFGSISQGKIALQSFNFVPYGNLTVSGGFGREAGESFSSSAIRWHLAALLRLLDRSVKCDRVGFKRSNSFKV